MPVKLCICQICNCGRHRCPHSPARLFNDPNIPCMISEYDSRYTGDPAEKVRSFKPKTEAYRDPDVAMEKDSTQHHDYVRHPLTAQPNFKPHLMYEAPAVGMDLSSSYGAEYTEKYGPKAKSCKPLVRKIGGGRFSGDATYDVDYKNWPIHKRQQVIPQDEWPDMGMYKFGNPSEAQTHFICHPDGKPADSAKPPQVVFTCPDPFTGKTSHQIDYTPKEAKDRYCRPKTVWQPPTIPHDMSSNYHENYRGSTAPPAASCKPHVAPYRCDGAMTGQSTHQHDFTKHALPPAIPKKPNVYEPCDVPMELCSSNHTDFVHWKGAHPPDSYKPKQRKLGGGRFFDEPLIGGNTSGPVDSVSHLDYPSHPNARPAELTRQRSEGFQFGEDSPTYHTTVQSSFQDPHAHLLVHHRPGKGVDQTEDHVVLGDDGTGRWLSTNHADYRQHELQDRLRRMPMDLVNSSGFTFGNDKNDFKTSNQDQYRKLVHRSSQEDLTAAGKRRGPDLFRTTSGLLFGSSSGTSSRFVTTSHQDFPGYTGDVERRKSKDQAYSSDVYFGQDQPGRETTTTNAYKAVQGGPREAVPHRDLFKTTDGFTLGYDYPEEARSPRYSTVDQRTRKRSRSSEPPRKYERERGYGNEYFYGDGGREEEERYSSVSKARRHDAVDEESRARVLSALHDELRSVGSEDANGFLWFPVTADEHATDHVSGPLPKWAANALKGASNTSERNQQKRNRDRNASFPSGSAFTADTDYARDRPARPNQQQAQAEKKSIPSSDEGLVLESLRNSPWPAPRGARHAERTASQTPGQAETEASSGREYPDSIESGRQTQLSDQFDPIDSLERDRPSSRERRGQSVEGLARRISEEGSLISASVQDAIQNNRDKIKVPRLIPVDHREDLSRKQRDAKGVAGLSTTSLRSEEDDRSKTFRTPSQERLMQTADDANSALPADAKRTTSKSKTTAQSEQTANGQMTSTADSSPTTSAKRKRGTSQPASASSSTRGQKDSASRRKGRRAIKDSSQRNQNPRTTSMGPLMDQGYREQTTTSQQDYTEKKLQEHTKEKSRNKKAQEKDSVLFEGAGLKVKHSPRPALLATRAATQEGAKVASGRDEDAKSNTTQNLVQTPAPSVIEPASDRQALATSPSPRYNAAATVGQQNWERAQPVRYPDSLHFDSTGKFEGTTTNQDYRAFGDMPARVQASSLDRKNLRSQIGNLMVDPGNEEPSSQNRRRARSSENNRSQVVERAQPFVPKDHQIFEKDNGFDGKTEKSEAYQALSASGDTRARSLRRTSQLKQLGDDHDKTDDRLLTVAQESYQRQNNTEGGRSQPFKPQSTFSLAQNQEGMPMQSLNQEAYDQTRALDVRRTMIRPQSSLDLFAAGDGNQPAQSVSQEAYQKGGSQGFDRRTAFVPRSTLNLYEGGDPTAQRSLQQDSFSNPGEAKRPQLVRRPADHEIFENDKAAYKTVSQEAFGEPSDSTDARQKSYKPVSTRNPLADEYFSSELIQTLNQATYKESPYQARPGLIRRKSAENLLNANKSENWQTASQEAYRTTSENASRPTFVKRSDAKDLLQQGDQQNTHSVSQDTYKQFTTEELQNGVRHEIRPKTDSQLWGSEANEAQHSVSQDAYGAFSSAELANARRKAAVPEHDHDILRREGGQDAFETTKQADFKNNGANGFESRAQRIRQKSAENLLNADQSDDWHTVSQDAYGEGVGNATRPSLIKRDDAKNLLQQDGDQNVHSLSQDTYKEFTKQELQNGVRHEIRPKADSQLWSSDAIGNQHTVSQDTYGSFSASELANARPKAAVPKHDHDILRRLSTQEAYETTKQADFKNMRPEGSESRAQQVRRKSAENLLNANQSDDWKTISQEAYGEATGNVTKPSLIRQEDAKDLLQQTGEQVGHSVSQDDYRKFTNDELQSGVRQEIKPQADHQLWSTGATGAQHSVSQDAYGAFSSSELANARPRAAVPEHDHDILRRLSTQDAYETTKQADFGNIRPEGPASPAQLVRRRSAENLLNADKSAEWQTVDQEAHREALQNATRPSLVKRDDTQNLLQQNGEHIMHSVSQDAYRKFTDDELQSGVRQEIRPQADHQLWSSGTVGAQHSVSQDAYGAFSSSELANARPKAVVPEHDHNILRENSEQDAFESTKQADFKGVAQEGSNSRLQQVRKKSAQNLLNREDQTEWETVNQKAYQNVTESNDSRRQLIRPKADSDVFQHSGTTALQSQSQEAYQSFGTHDLANARRDAIRRSSAGKLWDDQIQEGVAQSVSQHAYGAPEESKEGRERPKVRRSNSDLLLQNVGDSESTYIKRNDYKDCGEEGANSRAQATRRSSTKNILQGTVGDDNWKTANQEAYPNQTARNLSRPQAVKRQDQLNLFPSSDNEIAHTVSQDAYQGTQNFGRAQPAGKGTTGKLWETQNDSSPGQQSVSQNDYQGYSALDAAGARGSAVVRKDAGNILQQEGAIHGASSTSKTDYAFIQYERPHAVRPHSAQDLLGQGKPGAQAVPRTVNQDTYQGQQEVGGRTQIVHPEGDHYVMPGQNGAPFPHTVAQDAYHGFVTADGIRHLMRPRSNGALWEDQKDTAAGHTQSQDTYVEYSNDEMLKARAHAAAPQKGDDVLQEQGSAADRSQTVNQADYQFQQGGRAAAFVPRANSDLLLQGGGGNVPPQTMSQSQFGETGQARREAIVPTSNNDLLQQDKGSQRLPGSTTHEAHRNFSDQVETRHLAVKPESTVDLLNQGTGGEIPATASQAAYQSVGTQQGREKLIRPTDQSFVLGHNSIRSNEYQTTNQGTYHDVSSGQTRAPATRQRSTENLLGKGSNEPSYSVTHDAFQNVTSTENPRQETVRRRSQQDLLGQNGSASTSTTQQAYGPVHGELATYARPPLAVGKPDHEIFDKTGQISKTSSSQDAYQGVQGIRSQLVKPNGSSGVLSRLTEEGTGDSVSHEAFHNGYSMELRPEQIISKSTLDLKQDSKSRNQTSSQDAYQDYSKTVERPRRRGQSERRNSSGIFDNQSQSGNRMPKSVTQDAFNGLSVVGRGFRPAAVRPHDELNLFSGANPTPGSTSHEDYRKYPVSASSVSDRETRRRRHWTDASSVGSEPGFELQNGYSRRSSRADDRLPPLRSFSGTTTSQSAFQNPGMNQRRDLIRNGSSSRLVYPESWQNGPALSTSQAAFRGDGSGQRAELIRPRASSRIFDETGGGVSRSTAQDAYRDYGSLPPINRSRSNSQPPALIDHLGRGLGGTDYSPKTTVSQAAYRGYDVRAVDRSRPQKPDRLARLNPITGEVQVFKPVTDENGRTVRLVPTSGKVCPAALLEAGQASWKFMGNELGHLFYDIDT